MIAGMRLSTDHGSVVSRMGTIRRISANGALGGSGGIIVNSMKSYGREPKHQQHAEERIGYHQHTFTTRPPALKPPILTCGSSRILPLKQSKSGPSPWWPL